MDPNLPGGGPGRSHLGTFGLTEYEVEATTADGKTQKVKFVSAAADIAPPPETEVIAAFNEKKPVHRVLGPAGYANGGGSPSVECPTRGTRTVDRSVCRGAARGTTSLLGRKIDYSTGHGRRPDGARTQHGGGE
jgi:hypothetical protein